MKSNTHYSLIRIRAVNARRDITEGDHILILSTAQAYFHHGIYTGDGQVIDLIQPNDDATLQQLLIGGDGLVRQIDIEDFIGDNNCIFRVNYEDEDGSRRNNALQVARNFLQNPTNQPYALLVVNCESFATFCWTGRFSSRQIEIVMMTVFGVAVHLFPSLSTSSGFS